MRSSSDWPDYLLRYIRPFRSTLWTVDSLDSCSKRSFSNGKGERRERGRTSERTQQSERLSEERKTIALPSSSVEVTERGQSKAACALHASGL